MDERVSLETKLADLLRALKVNDKDEWSGKPAQISFDALVTEGKTEVSRSLDSLMENYVAHIKQLREYDAAPTSIPVMHTLDKREEGPSLAELLNELDGLPPLSRLERP